MQPLLNAVSHPSHKTYYDDLLLWPTAACSINAAFTEDRRPLVLPTRSTILLGSSLLLHKASMQLDPAKTLAGRVPQSLKDIKTIHQLRNPTAQYRRL